MCLNKSLVYTLDLACLNKRDLALYKNSHVSTGPYLRLTENLS